MNTAGPNLRRLYLPGLDPLKLELSRFELLLATHQPQLHQHLLEAGLPALLYAAQWLMTTYSCPFPVHVAARVLDVLLQSGSDTILPRLGLEVMRELQPHLLELDDFEALITYLKVWCLMNRAHMVLLLSLLHLHCSWHWQGLLNHPLSAKPAIYQAAELHLLCGRTAVGIYNDGTL